MSRSKNTPLWVAALLSKDLTPVEFRVWMLLQRYQGRNDSAWPSQGTLAADLGLTVEGVRRIVNRLTAKGWLRVIRPAHTCPGRGVEYAVQGILNHPTGGTGERPTGHTSEHPTGQAGITPPAKPRHIGRSKSGINSGNAQIGVPIYPPDFERFWEAYPKRIAKAKAATVWAALDPSPELAEQVIAAVRAWSQSKDWQKANGEFIPLAVNWLSDRRWTDELPAKPEPAEDEAANDPTPEEAAELIRKAMAGANL